MSATLVKVTVTYDGHLPSSALLNLSQEPWWETAGIRYPITRLQSEMPNWGIEMTYEVPRPEGGRAVGSCSNHDGCGVTTPDGGWGFKFPAENTTLLGPQTRLKIDRERRRVVVETAEPPPMLPYIICGLCILLD
jgi:hypothetical protein